MNSKQLGQITESGWKEAESDAGKDDEEVTVTISEDFAEGLESKLDSDLQILLEPELDLVLPNLEVDEAATHLIDLQSTGVDALADYQMQLLLLEQQNKIRLRIARQEQMSSDADEAQNVRPRSKQQQPKSISEVTNQVRRRASRRKHVSPQSVDPAIPTKSMVAHRSDSGIESIPSADAIAEGVEGDTASANVLAMSESISSSDEQIYQTLLPYISILYRITCTHNTSDHHPFVAFEDMPVLMPRKGSMDPVRSGLPHFGGYVPIVHLEEFMEDDSSDSDFVIMRHVECSKASVLIAMEGEPIIWTQSIYARSRTAVGILEQVATCYYNSAAQEEQKGNSFFPGEASQTPAFERRKIQHEDLFFFHHQDALMHMTILNRHQRLAVQALGNYVNHIYQDDFSRSRELFARGMVDHNHVLRLFKPNELLVSGTFGQPAVFVLQCWAKRDSQGYTELRCWTLHTDGHGFARKADQLTILPLKDKAVSIKTLAAYPLRYADQTLIDSLLVRGRRHWGLRVQAQVSYEGWSTQKEQYFSDARFMIDNKMYHKMHKNSSTFNFSRPKLTYPFDTMPAHLDLDQVPSDTVLLLLQPHLQGFYLTEKKWISLLVDNVRPVMWNKKAFERLVLPHRTKELIRALISVRASRDNVRGGFGVNGKRTDITGGKGGGLIMLLHGGPGTGKTLTGESVAEMAEMPLYRVTCGDIGINAEAVERYLNTVLYLGKCWNCVLLLDEADIFLEERSNSDLERNSLVSVFLRILEYYDGILILTSNRVGMFDEAFKSRIQVALHYENLTRSARRTIWSNFLEMLDEDDEDVNFDELRLRLDDLASRSLNGRQIRNVLTTARQLAAFQKERLDWQHLEQALSVAADFNAYLQRMQGHTDDERARDAKYR